MLKALDPLNTLRWEVLKKPMPKYEELKIRRGIIIKISFNYFLKASEEQDNMHFR